MSSIETLSPGVAQSGVADQYADGVAAQNWLLYIGEQENRTTNYKNFLINLLKEKKLNQNLKRLTRLKTKSGRGKKKTY